jgi:hypothetical protein
MKGRGMELKGKGFVIRELRWESRLPNYTGLWIKKFVSPVYLPQFNRRCTVSGCHLLKFAHYHMTVTYNVTRMQYVAIILYEIRILPFLSYASLLDKLHRYMYFGLCCSFRR